MVHFNIRNPHKIDILPYTEKKCQTVLNKWRPRKIASSFFEIKVCFVINVWVIKQLAYDLFG